MLHRNTTNPATLQALKPVFVGARFAEDARIAEQIRFKIAGVYRSKVGPEWGSQGREESDFYHHIHLVCGGQAQVQHQGIDYLIENGQAYFFVGNSPMVRVAAENYDHYAITFRCESILGSDFLLDWPGRRPMPLGSWNRKQWPELLVKGRTVNAYLALQGQLALWMANSFPTLGKILTAHYQSFSRYHKVLEVIERRLGADLRVRDLAMVYGTSIHAFSMAFMRDTGKSPKFYLNQRLNQKACHLLAETNLAIKDIAETLGFADQLYFSRFFSKMNGLPPGKYRQSFEATKDER